MSTDSDNSHSSSGSDSADFEDHTVFIGNIHESFTLDQLAFHSGSYGQLESVAWLRSLRERPYYGNRQRARVTFDDARSADTMINDFGNRVGVFHEELLGTNVIPFQIRPFDSDRFADDGDMISYNTDEANFRQNDEIERLKQENSELAANHENSERRCEIKNARIRDLSSEIAELKKKSEVDSAIKEDLSDKTELNAKLSQEIVALKEKITDLVNKSSEKDSKISEQKQNSMKKSTDFEIRNAQQNLKISMLELQNTKNDETCKTLTKENVKLKDEARIERHRSEQQHGLMEALMTRKSLDTCANTTRTGELKKEISTGSVCDEKSQQMLKILEEDNAELLLKNRGLRVSSKVLEKENDDLKTENNRVTEQLEQTETTLKIFKAEKEELRAANSRHENKIKQMEKMEISLVHNIHELENKNKYLQEENRSVKLDMKSRRRKLKDFLLSNEFEQMEDSDSNENIQAKGGPSKRPRNVEQTDVNNNGHF